MKRKISDKQLTKQLFYYSPQTLSLCSFNSQTFQWRSISRWFDQQRVGWQKLRDVISGHPGCHVSKIIQHLLFQSSLTLGNNKKYYLVAGELLSFTEAYDNI